MEAMMAAKRLGPFRVLVGSNASGKSAFLDVPAFLVLHPEMDRTAWNLM